MSRQEIIGDATLYLGDCREVLPTLGRVDAVVTDPPYGLDDLLSGGRSKWRLHDGGAETQRWDAQPSTVVSELGEWSEHQIIWGGQFYGLAPSRGWLIWNKIIRNWSSSECELAWTTLEQPNKAFDYSHGQLVHEAKEHPTQKPLPLMEWCLGFLPDAHTILDPFMGSGTTGVAALKLGRRFIGIEIEPKYFDIACRRIEEAWKQPRLFEEPKPQPVQGVMEFEP